MVFKLNTNLFCVFIEKGIFLFRTQTYTHEYNCIVLQGYQKILTYLKIMPNACVCVCACANLNPLTIEGFDAIPFVTTILFHSFTIQYSMRLYNNNKHGRNDNNKYRENLPKLQLQLPTTDCKTTQLHRHNSQIAERYGCQLEYTVSSVIY